MVEYKQGKEIINTFNHIEEILFYSYDNEKKDYEENINYFHDLHKTHIFKNLFVLRNKEKIQKLVNNFDDYDDHLLIKIDECQDWGVSGNDIFDDLGDYTRELSEENPHKFIVLTVKEILKGLYKWKNQMDI